MKITASDIFGYLESLAPLHLQESYDNSGLIIGSARTEVTGVIVCLDCTEDVLDEAVRKGCNVVISHHPPVFYGLKTITGSNLTERVVMKAIREDLILYAIHTNLDNVLAHGVNERIARHLGLEVKSILRGKDGGNAEMVTGAGLIGYFQEPVPEVEFLQMLKERMGATVVRHTRLLSKPIERVAICGGSGSFLLEDARRAGAHAFVTADYKYHGFFDADGDLLVCDIGHYESEQFTVQLLQELISGKYATFAAHCTEINTNPVHYFT